MIDNLRLDDYQFSIEFNDLRFYCTNTPYYLRAPLKTIFLVPFFAKVSRSLEFKMALPFLRSFKELWTLSNREWDDFVIFSDDWKVV